MRKLGFGCMRLPLAEAGNFKAVDIAEVERMVDTFLERGFTISPPRTTAPSSASTASPSPPA